MAVPGEGALVGALTSVSLLSLASRAFATSMQNLGGEGCSKKSRAIGSSCMLMAALKISAVVMTLILIKPMNGWPVDLALMH